MSLRVIGGKAKGRRLKPVPGDTTRPIMDRVKEALFNIMSPGIKNAAWLDMFAGTGSVGIEALSRGAGRVVFLDRAGPAIKTIHENLAITNLAENARVIRSDAFAYLERDAAEQFDVVYVAPPQYEGLWARALHALDGHTDWLNPDAVIIAQIDPHEREAISLAHLEAYDERVYGNTLLWFFEFPGA